jgi:hypothetical protein
VCWASATDLTKALGCVSHEIPLTKLQFYGMQIETVSTANTVVCRTNARLSANAMALNVGKTNVIKCVKNLLQQT